MVPAQSKIENTLTKLGFAKAEAQCLLYLARVKKATTTRISRETNITYNLSKVMLKNLVERGLINQINTPDQDTYEFLGASHFEQYLSNQKNEIVTNYDQAMAEFTRIFG